MEVTLIPSTSLTLMT